MWIERISPATSAAQPREFVCNSIKILSAVFLSPQTCPYFIVCIVVQPTAGVCIILLEERKSSPALSCVSSSLFYLFVCCVKWRNPISKFSEIDMRISGIWKTYKLVAVAVALIAFQRERNWNEVAENTKWISTLLRPISTAAGHSAVLWWEESCRA